MEWGDINRFQRINDNIESTFDDTFPSIPVGFTSSQWGQIPSYSSKPYPYTKKMYGINGNSFICAVEFMRQGNKKIKAKSLLAGGESGNPASNHFTDQASMYTKGQFKEILFYKEDVMKHEERIYHPGE
jgi:acyl-homoserine lactone acylase PvdQ